MPCLCGVSVRGRHPGPMRTPNGITIAPLPALILRDPAPPSRLVNAAPDVLLFLGAATQALPGASPMSVMTIPSPQLYPARMGERPLTAEDIWSIPRVGSPIPSPDGTMLAVTVTTYDLEKNAGKGRIWLVPARA